MSALPRAFRDSSLAVRYPAKPAPTITMRGRLTVRLRGCRVPREPSASPWPERPNAGFRTGRRVLGRSPLYEAPYTRSRRRYPHARIRLFPVVRGVRSRGTGRTGSDGGTGGLPLAVDLRPLPPVERRAGPEPLRVVGDRRALGGGVPSDRDGRDLPDRTDPPGGGGAGRGDLGRDDERPLPPRRRLRRGPQRARARPCLAARAH